MKKIFLLISITSVFFVTATFAQAPKVQSEKAELPAPAEPIKVDAGKAAESSQLAPEQKPAENVPAAESYSTFEQAFSAGIQHYRKENFKAARDAFSRCHDFQPENSYALTNLALAQFKVGETGLAIALLRKVLGISPDLSTPRVALEFILSKQPTREIPHEIRTWDQLRTNFLNPIGLRTYLAMAALFLFSAGWLVLKYLGERRRAIKQDLPLPAFSSITFLVTLSWILVSFLATAKLFDHFTPRGTVILEKVSVKSAPNETSAQLFDLYSGLEVVLKRQEGDWIQVNYPGAMSGWVPKNSVFHTSGRITW